MAYSKLASAIYNDIVSGLRGYSSTMNLSIELLEDEIVEERLSLIKQYIVKGVIPKNDLLRTISCIPVDCKDISGCCSGMGTGEVKHFEIPMLMTDFGRLGIEYIGSTDLQNPFNVYTKPSSLKFRKYRKYQSNKPYVFINVTPNENGKCDGWIFNAPFLQLLTVIGVFKDERLLVNCKGNCEDIENPTFLDAEIKDRLTKRKVLYYRQLATPIQPNDQTPK